MPLVPIKKQLSVIEFGRLLVETGDLDPLYIALWKAEMPRVQLCRWLVAYFCYYHAGLCCWISEQPGFFKTLLQVANGGTNYPRGSERRHFRGNLAVTSIQAMQRQFKTATDVVDFLIAGGPTAVGVMQQVKKLRGFGNWISWKVPDMLERLGLAKIEFVDSDVRWMFKSSKQGAEEVCSVLHFSGRDGLVAANEYILRNLRGLTAPPRHERPLNVQETETVLCKFHSYLGGHYPPGKDTHELRQGLLRYARCRTTQKLLRGLQHGR